MRDFLKEKVLPGVLAIGILVGAYMLYGVFNPPPGRKTPKATVTTYLQGFENANYSSIYESYIPAIGKPLDEFFDLGTSVEESTGVLMKNMQIAEALSMYNMLLPANVSKAKLSIMDYEETIEGNNAMARVKLGINDEFSDTYLMFWFEKVGEDWLITRSYAEQAS